MFSWRNKKSIMLMHITLVYTWHQKFRCKESTVPWLINPVAEKASMLNFYNQDTIFEKSSHVSEWLPQFVCFICTCISCQFQQSFSHIVAVSGCCRELNAHFLECSLTEISCSTCDMIFTHSHYTDTWLTSSGPKLYFLNLCPAEPRCALPLQKM